MPQGTGTLHLWDFDDTLAASSTAVLALQSQYPQVKWSQWWHDPEWSSLAARVTQPHLAGWHTLASTPGTHWILTGRVLDALQAWFAQNRTQPWSDALRHVTRIVSVSGYDTTGSAAQRKAAFVAQECGRWPHVVFYDDSPACLDLVRAACPRVETHQVIAGAIVNPRSVGRTRRAPT
jgi:hypothetical protein